jgi:hypothetical protein
MWKFLWEEKNHLVLDGRKDLSKFLIAINLIANLIIQSNSTIEVLIPGLKVSASLSATSMNGRRRTITGCQERRVYSMTEKKKKKMTT